MEQQNKVLLAELEQLTGLGKLHLGDLYEEEMQELCLQVNQITSNKTRVKVEWDTLAEGIMWLQEKLQHPGDASERGSQEHPAVFQIGC